MTLESGHLKTLMHLRCQFEILYVQTFKMSTKPVQLNCDLIRTIHGTSEWKDFLIFTVGAFVYCEVAIDIKETKHKSVTLFILFCKI